MTGTQKKNEPLSWPEGAELTSVPVDDFPLALDVLETAFPDLSRTFFHSITMRDPAYKPEYGLAVRLGRRFLAYIQIFERSVLIGKDVVSFGGIGSVATRPDHRGFGYASALLNRAAEVIPHYGMIGSFLFTTIHPFYQRLGWSVIKQEERDISIQALKGSSYRPDWSRSMRMDDIPPLHEIYVKMLDRMNGGVVRSKEYWRARASWLNHFPVIVMNDGDIIGYFYYAKYDLAKPVMTVSEFGYADSDDETFDRMLRVMSRKAEEIQCGIIRGFFLQDPDFGSYCSNRNLFVGKRDFNYLMWKDLSDEKYVQRLQAHADIPRLIFWSTDAF